MAPLSLKVVQDEGAVTRTVKVDSKASVDTALDVVKEKFMIADDGKAYGLFLTSADCDRTGVWLEGFRNVEYYMLRDGDTLLLLCKTRNLRLRMLDGSVKTLQVDESQPISQMMSYICARIGITNHEEYGLCYEDVEEETESKVTSTGTLTLKRGPPSREKDAKLEHMSKKFKTDDNVQWLEMHRTLREMEVGPSDTLLLKRRLFYTDRNVDARDPVQLNLLFVQTRDAILQGRHPVTLDQACEFAGIQCQILYGDYQEEKHKSGFIDYKELLPSSFWGKLGLEKKILKVYRKHQGLSSLDAKFVYNKTARDMPTYGVTFFVVKEKQPKGKKKLVPRLLGISANAILRLDEETKEIMQAWPLTQVKSYQVGKSHTFTLNFGDYSDKEYSVKTNDAVRIRDILQGYIDIIAKRMAGGASGSMNDGASVMEDTVQVSKGTYMQHVKNNPSKVVEETFVGPTKIIAYEPGQTASQGTQLVTASTLVVTHQVNQQQYQTSGQVPLRKEMSLEFAKKLNRMNSNSVKVVTLITSDDGPHTAELKNLVSTMEADMPLIEAGVTEILKKDMDAAGKKRLQDELKELGEQLKTLSKNVYGADPGSDASLEAASKVADLSTQMYLGLDPLTKRRSNLVRLSRQSFIEDEKLQANLHRASFISAASSACTAVDNASMLVNQGYEGPALSPSQVEDLEQAARDKMRKLNGAVALFLTAHADPENIDFSAAITSMNTINELILELAKDSQALASTKDGASKQELIDDINKLCDATRLVCTLTGCTDSQKMQDVTSVYGPVADKLIFTFGRGRRDDNDNRIIDLAKAVGEKTSMLLVKANELTGLVPHSAAAQELDDVGVQCAGAASDLLACAMLTSPCIHEPHCQSALTASAETLSTAAQKVLVAAKPLLKEQSMRQHGGELKEKSLELAKALDALKNAYGNNMDVDGSSGQERQRLKFVMTLRDTNKGIDDAEKELNKPSPPLRHDASPVIAAMLEKNLAQRTAEYNSAVAALLVATSDRDNPNYEAAEAALNTVNELIPGIIKDTRTLAASRDEATRQVMLEDLRKLCEATRGICASASSGNIEDLNESAATLANTSNKLYFTFNPYAPPDKEQEILDIATAACTKASQMLANVYQLAEETGGTEGQQLDARGAKMADGAKALLTCAQLTAGSIETPACQSSLIQAADALSASSTHVANSCSNIQGPLVDKLRHGQRELEDELEKLRRACQGSKGHGEVSSKFKEMQRLKFVKSMSAAKAGLAHAQDELNKPYDGIPPKGEAAMMRQHHLSKSLAKLNAGMATLTAATSDLDNPNYEAANEALAIINETMPLVIKETKAMSSVMSESDKKGALEDLQRLCRAARGVCDAAHQDPEKLQQFAKEFSASSGKLVFMFNPHAKPAAANQVMKQAYEACKTGDQIVRDSLRLGEQLPASDVTAEKMRLHVGKTKTAADSLMTSAQLIAASMDDPHCQSALLSSVNTLSSSAQQLAHQWTPLQAHADELLIKKLDAGHKDLQHQLEEMRREYQKKPTAAGKSAEEDHQRQKFVKSAAAAKRELLDIEKELNMPYTGTLPKGEVALIRQHHLSKSLAKLNAALAALAAATADPDDPDYEAASKAMATINETLPLVVKETKVLASVKEDSERQAMVAELRRLCEATRGVCDTAQQDPDKLREFAKECGAASGKLVFVLNPHANPTDVNQVMKEVNEACKTADRLVNDAHMLADQLPALGFMAESEQIRDRAEKTVHATDSFTTSAQLTASSIDDPHCQSALLSSIETLSSSAQHLSQVCAALHGKADEPLMKKLDTEYANLRRQLESMRREYNKSHVGKSGEEERQRLQFIKSAAAAKRGLVEIEKELSKPYTGNLPKAEQAICQHQLSDAMSRLNAAIAALTAATADPDNPDYLAADEAMATISEIMPLVVKDTKAMASSKDEKSREAMLSELRALCDATRHICDGEKDPQQLRESARKFGAASGKLVFALNPQAKPANVDKVKKQVDEACCSAKQLVHDSTKLAGQLASDTVSQKIHHAGKRTVASADALLTTAQLTAPSLEDPRCEAALLLSVDALSLSAHQLAQQWTPLQDQDKRGLVVKLDKDHGALQLQLEAVRKECQGDESDSRPATKEQKRVRFADSVAVAKSDLRDIEQELSKPYSGTLPKQETKALRQRNLSSGLARLNAALAALAAATADPENPDYAAADDAMSTIHETLPLVVKDTKVMAAAQDDITKEVMLGNARALCQAMEGICDSAERNPVALRDFAKKFAAASGKLVSVVNARAKSTSANQVMEATQAASKTANQLAKTSVKLSDQLGPSTGAAARVREGGSRVVHDADTLLTAAQLTAPCISDPHCQSSLSSSINNLSSSAQELKRHWSPLTQEPILIPIIRELEMEHQKLTSELGVLKTFCQDSKKGKANSEEVDGQRVKEAQKNQYIAKAAAAKEAMKTAEKELDKPVVGPSAKGEAAALQQQQLSQRLAKLHAALLALSIATSDNNNPDYVAAEKAIDTIRELMPHVVKNTNSLLSSKDSASQVMPVSELRALCHGAGEICDSAEQQDSAKLNDQLTKNVIPRLGKLYYVVHPNVGTTKLGKVEACAKAACSKASQLLTNVFQLAEATDSATGLQLDGKGAVTADAAKALLTAVQLTGPYIHEAEAQSTLISVADVLSSSAKDIAAVWKPLLKDPKYKAVGEKLKRYLQELEVELEKFRKACKEPEPENIVHKTSKPKPPPPPRKPEDQEMKKMQFSIALEKVGSGLQAAEADIKRMYNAKLDAPQMHKDQVRGIQKALESKIALSNVATSALLACNATEPMDYAAAAKHATELANLLPKITQDAKVLSNAMSENKKEAFLSDILAMFAATKKVIETAQTDGKNLNGVAMEFGNQTGALLYSLSTDVDSSHEKEVISRTKDIGECVSQITMTSDQIMSDLKPEKANEMCAAGKQCATAAGNLVYTAKLVAPSIQIAECQDILKSAAQALSTKIKAFSSLWTPLNADPEKKAVIQELNEKTRKAEGLLEELRKDLDSGKLIKVRPSQPLVVEDTPLRKLTAALVENAMKKSSNPSTSPDQKRALAEYARALTDASEQLDRANAICKKEPHDLDNSRDLEEAVQKLQVLALQSRPSANQQQQYIVDLTEFVKELSREAEQMLSTVASCSVKHKEINSTCQTITADAERIVHPSNDMNRGDGTTVDDIYEVDRFGKTTDARVKKISSQIKVLPQCTDKDMLHTQSVNLEDSCNILRFATQSAIATTQSASLDMTLHDLCDLETRINSMLQPGAMRGRRVDEPIPWLLRSNLLKATRNVSSQQQLCSALTQYILEQRARTDLTDPKANKRLNEHLRKLTHLLRIVLVQTSRHVATWQELDGPELAALTEQVLREIEAGCHNQSKKQESSVLPNIDLNRLLLSTDVIKIEGDRKHVEDKMQQTASKLSSLLSTVVASSGKPDSLMRSLAVTADTAGELAALARALKKTDDPVYNTKVEEAASEATFQTYNVLKTSELVSQEPNNPAYRRRLLDACRLLNDALNNLGRTTSPQSNAMQRDCSELSRALQLQQTLLQAALPTCALPYKDCLDALSNQQEVIQKLNRDEPMSRLEFARTLGYISSAVCNSAELAAQCGYLMSLPERDQEATKIGVVDVQQLKKVTEAAQATCYRMLQLDPVQAKEEAVHLTQQIQEIDEALKDARKKSQHLRAKLFSPVASLCLLTEQLNKALNEPTDRAKISAATTELLGAIKELTTLTEHPSIVPVVGNVTAEAQQRSDHVLSAARDLTNKTASLVRDVKTHDAHDNDNGPMTWVTFNLKRKDVVKAFEALLASVRENGQRAGILEVEAEEEAPKSYVQLQVDLANKWLKRPNCKPEVKASGEDAAKKVIDVAEKMVDDMKESEKEDMCALITETKDLLGECSKKCTPDKASLLVERLKGLKKAIERGVITMVVEDLIEGEEPLQDLEILVDSETDESKRKFLLERKIAELLAQLGRVSRTARAVASTGVGGQKAQLEINKSTEQANLLAPLLVKAAQERINSPDNKAVIENYKSLLAQYAESLSKVRELCDQSVDPMEFVQTAGETMQRMREESSHDNDPQKCVYTSTAITKLANRVIQVSMSSPNAKQDPELRKALSEAQQRLEAAVPGPQTRQSKMPDWKDTTAEILRTTGEVEAVMGGENIFQNQPQSDQPIFAAARELHTAVREWSARDNEIVGAAKKMAVLMAKLSAYMNNNAQHELIVTSKSIVTNAHEVAELARKLAHECTDMRIKTNLLQVCDRIPTISGQLKMLTTVKGSTLSRQGNKEDQESLKMLVDNAQNLMLSIQEVVKASAGASVKIAAQRGGVRVRWVRKAYYY